MRGITALCVFTIALGVVSSAGRSDRHARQIAPPNAPLTPATSTVLDQPWALAVDGAANLYIADTANHLVRRVAPDGAMNVIAGTGKPGFTGDEAPAVEAALNSPMGVAVDGAGNVFIADTQNQRIRKVTVSGIITTVARDLNRPRGVAVTAAGDLIVADTGNNRVRRIAAAGVATNVAENARLKGPTGVAVDRDGNIYVADTDNHRVLRISSSGDVATIAGTGRAGFMGDGGPAHAAQLNRPIGLAVDGADLLIADMDNHRVRRITATGTISTVTSVGAEPSRDRGRAGSTDAFQPSSVAADGAGHIWIADLTTNRVRLLVADGFSATVAGLVPTRGFSGDGGPATAARLSGPRGVAIDAIGNLFIADTGNGRIRQVTPDGVIRTVAGAGDTGLRRDDVPATRAQLNEPKSIVVDADGNVLIAGGDRLIRKIVPGGPITTVAGTGSRQPGATGDGGPATDARIGNPLALAIGIDGSFYVGSEDAYRLRRVDASGRISTVAGRGSRGSSGDGGAAIRAEISNVNGVAADRDGNLYFIDAGVHIRRVSTDGTCTTLVSTGIDTATSLAIDAQGNLFVADAGAHVVRRIDRAGTLTTIAGTGARGIGGDGGKATAAQLDAPAALALDRDGNLYVADLATDRVRKISAAGIITTVAGGGR